MGKHCEYKFKITLDDSLNRLLSNSNYRLKICSTINRFCYLFPFIESIKINKDFTCDVTINNITYVSTDVIDLVCHIKDDEKGKQLRK